MVAQQAALLRNDGVVVDCSNTFSPVLFPDLNNTEAYYVVLRHRNHLDVMSTNAITPTAGLLSYDFTIGIEQVYGNTLVILNEMTGYTALSAGDIDGNGLISHLDFNLYLANLNNNNAYQISDTNGDTQITVADFNLYKANASQIGVGVLRY